MHFTEKLHQAGLKSTPARVAILRFLQESSVAQTHADLIKKLSERGIFSDRTTVYRTLDALHEAGVVHKIPTADRQWLFSLSGTDSSGHDAEHHLHFRCEECEKTFCMEAEQLSVQVRLDEKTSRQFHVTGTELLLHGTCPGCSA